MDSKKKRESKAWDRG